MLSSFPFRSVLNCCSFILCDRFVACSDWASAVSSENRDVATISVAESAARSKSAVLDMLREFLYFFRRLMLLLRDWPSYWPFDAALVLGLIAMNAVIAIVLMSTYARTK